MNARIVITGMCPPIMADKSCNTYGQNKIHEISRMWKTKLAEKSADKERLNSG
jgi:hypothetical protein